MKNIKNIDSYQNISTKNQGKAKQSTQSKDTPSTSEPVTLTKADSHLKNVAQELNNTSTVDAARIAKVQSAISNGEYTVDAKSIADKMLAFEDFMNK